VQASLPTQILLCASSGHQIVRQIGLHHTSVIRKLRKYNIALPHRS
jgi:hypothetical protein